MRQNDCNTRPNAITLNNGCVTYFYACYIRNTVVFTRWEDPYFYTKITGPLSLPRRKKYLKKNEQNENSFKGVSCSIHPFDELTISMNLREPSLSLRS